MNICLPLHAYVIVASPVVAAILAATAFGQSPEPPKPPPTPTEAAPARPGKQSTAKPTEKPAQEPGPASPPFPVPRPPSPDFPGASLFNSHPPFLVGVKVNHDDMLYRDGDKVWAEFTVEKEAHLYLIYHQADGTSLLMFPNEAKIDNRIPAGKTVTIPPLDQDYRFRVGPPLGKEVFQVIASLEPLDELDGLVKKTGRAAVVSREALAKLCDRLLKEPASWTEHRVPIHTIAKQALPPERKPSRAGLFIGVDKYQDPKLSEPLEQIRRSAEQMAKAMQERGKLDPSRVKTILGEEATRANIEEAITKWLPSVTQPGDTVFIYYMGHGSTVESLDPNKPGGRDGLLAAYDNDLGRINSQEEFAARAREKLISDDALARWLQELSGRQIVLMLEACHSGSMIDAQVLGKFLARQAALTKGISQLNMVAIVGCGVDESIVTLKAEETAHMARYLSAAMRDLPAPLPVRQAYEHYRQRLKEWMRSHRLQGTMEPVMIDSALLSIPLVP
jgi:hypothetical protein